MYTNNAAYLPSHYQTNISRHTIQYCTVYRADVGIIVRGQVGSTLVYVHNYDPATLEVAVAQAAATTLDKAKYFDSVAVTVADIIRSNSDNSDVIAQALNVKAAQLYSIAAGEALIVYGPSSSADRPTIGITAAQDFATAHAHNVSPFADLA